MPPSGTPIDDLTPSVDVEDFFVHIYEATNDDGWTNVQEKFDKDAVEHDGRICYRFSGCGSCMTRLKFVVSTPLAANSLMIRPEVSSRSMSEITGLLHSEYRYQINPGDAVVELGDEEKEASLRGYAMRQILESPSLSQAVETGDAWNSYSARMIVRHNVPEPGMAAMVVLPIGRRHTVVFQVGAVKAYTLTVQPHSEPGKVIVAHVMFLPFSAYPTWATQHFSRLAKLEQSNFLRYVKGHELPRLCEIDKTYYTVLHLRGCNRGVPLLPCSNNEARPDPSENSNVVVISGEDGAESYWIRWTDCTFTFEAYLRQLLHRCGIELKVFTELSGRKLVPYQVAVLTHEWESSKDEVVAAFHTQQRAYRRMNGGVSAPRVGEAQQARFQHADPQPKSKCFVRSSCDMVVRKTFIDMSESDYTEGNRQGWIGANNQVGGALMRSSSAAF
mmetsp:Transcript_69125/g.84748  ORF Transcript_69125/g.84748 Transcript_69125/m.84748 type:complete len:445 (+) Transcript_69125:36-1370(+)